MDSDADVRRLSIGRRPLRASMACCALLAVCARPASAFRVEARAPVELAAAADLVFRGEVVDAWSDLVLTERVSIPVTRFLIDATEFFKGVSSAGNVCLTLPRAFREDGTWTQADGTPWLDLGDRVIVHAVAVDDANVTLVNLANGLLKEGRTEFGEPVAVDGQDRPLSALDPFEAPEYVAPAEGVQVRVDGDHCVDGAPEAEEADDAGLPLDPFVGLTLDEAAALVVEAVALVGDAGVPGAWIGGCRAEEM